MLFSTVEHRTDSAGEVSFDLSHGLYQILTARFGGSTKLCDAELFVGKASLAEDPALYRLALDQLETRLFKALDGMRGREEGSPRLRLYREVEMQVKELRKSV